MNDDRASGEAPTPYDTPDWIRNAKPQGCLTYPLATTYGRFITFVCALIFSAFWYCEIVFIDPHASEAHGGLFKSILVVSILVACACTCWLAIAMIAAFFLLFPKLFPALQTERGRKRKMVIVMTISLIVAAIRLLRIAGVRF